MRKYQTDKVRRKMMVLRLCCVLLLFTASLAVYDFTHFESELFVKWQRIFLAGEHAAGQYSLLPVSKHNQTSFYGATDLVYAFHAVGQLDLLSSKDRLHWASTIKQFQNTSGWIDLFPWEEMHTANPPYANVTWHAIGAAIETLQLLGASSLQPSEFLLPLHVQSVGKLISQGTVAWEAFMQRWLSKYHDVWMGSQAVQSLAAAVMLAHIQYAPSDATDAHVESFFPWMFAYLNATVSAASGMWDGSPHQNPMHQLGGAFHIQHVYECFDGEYQWPKPRAAVDTTLNARHQKRQRHGHVGQQRQVGRPRELEGDLLLYRPRRGVFRQPRRDCCQRRQRALLQVARGAGCLRGVSAYCGIPPEQRDFRARAVPVRRKHALTARATLRRSRVPAAFPILSQNSEAMEALD